jgi:adenine C2-methylase RlmN of 23S rRNA A2503 and tRNA A37
MAPKRTLGRHSFFDAPALLAFLEDGLGPGKRDTAERHRRTIQEAAVAAADRGSGTLDLSVAAVPNLPAFARERLPEAFALLTSSVDSVATSGDGTTAKFVVKLQDGHRVESVLMRHDGGRNTLCVSSQVGCKMGCTFCATGTLGELGNLTSGEILEQLAHARRFAAAKGNGETDAVAFRAAEASAAVTNVVFMGMGEPLNNYDAVCASLGLLSDARGFAVAPSRVTVSTVGVVPKMLALARDSPEVRLALSLHAPNQALREKIVPTATAYPLPKIMAALDAYLAAGTRARTRAMIEYCVLGGVNDEEAHAFELGELLRGRDVIVNLIPFNPTDTPMGHTPPTREAVQAMAAVLAGPPFGLRTTVRKEMGQDIAGACGQLALDAGGAKRAGGAGGDLEDLAGSAPRNGFARAKTVADKKLKKGSVVNGRVARAFKEDVQTNKSRTTSVQTMTPVAPRRATDVTKKKQIPRDVELAVAALNATATISMVVLVLAVSWKLAAHAGWFEDHERQHAEL